MNKICTLLFFTMLFTGMYGQSADTVIVYDHIIIYDTIKVYDTLIVYDTANIQDEFFFKNNNSVQNATLVIDTSEKKIGVRVFFQKDTATIPINSITLSETNLSLDTMKKELLALAAATLFSNAIISQSDSANTKMLKANESSLNIKESQSYGIETVVFQKKNSDQKYEVFLPAMKNIQFKNKMLRQEFLPTSSFFGWGQGTYIITHIDTSIVKVKFHPSMKWSEAKEYGKELKKIRTDRTLSDEEKENKYFLLTYGDSVIIPVEAIKSMRFSRFFNTGNKRFYNSAFRVGFNEEVRHRNASFFTAYLPWYTSGVYLLTTAAITLPVGIAISAGATIAGVTVKHFALEKKISLKRWNIVPQ